MGERAAGGAAATAAASRAREQQAGRHLLALAPAADRAGVDRRRQARPPPTDEYRQPLRIFNDIKQYDLWMRGTALDDGDARRVTDLLHDQLGGDEHARQLDASAPAAEQLSLFAEVGWPNGPPCAGYFKNKVVELAEQNHLDDYDRISARCPRFEVVFPMTLEQYSSVRPCTGSYAGDPVYWLTCRGRMVEPDEEEELGDNDCDEFDIDEFVGQSSDGMGD